MAVAPVELLPVMKPAWICTIAFKQLDNYVFSCSSGRCIDNPQPMVSTPLERKLISYSSTHHYNASKGWHRGRKSWST